jgi:hypothetical protein
MICDAESVLCRRWHDAGSAPLAIAGVGWEHTAIIRVLSERVLRTLSGTSVSHVALHLELQLRAAPFGSLVQLALGPGGDGWLRSTVACR